MAHHEIDVGALYAALDAQRTSWSLSWRDLAKKVGVSPSTFTRLGNGHQPDVNAFARLVRWLGLPAERFFLQPRCRDPQPELVAELAPLLRARQDLSEQDVEYLEDLITAAVKRFASERERG